jgi:mannose-1-phosphate guanylyltransferase/mannose-6-phosphate isomerase
MLGMHAAPPAACALILAGGSGTRLWPLSTDARPKPFLPLAGGDSLLRETFRRAAAVTGEENVWISARRSHAELVRKDLPEVPASHLVLEPCRRNTAPAIALSALAVEAEAPGAILVVLPSDQAVRDEEAFVKALRTAVEAARSGDAFVTLGIPPTRPETGFGYMEIEEKRGGPEISLEGEEGRGHSVRRVLRFVEKPARDVAESYVRGGRHLWNAGIFVFRISHLLDEMKRSCPGILDTARRAHAALLASDLSSFVEAFSSSPSVSIDYAVMEKARRVLTVPCDCGWSDLGSWEAIRDFRTPDAHGNVLEGDVTAIDATDNLVLVPGKPVCVIGVAGLAVVESPDGLLVTRRDALDELRRYVEGTVAKGTKA